MVTGGKISGTDAAEAILTYISETYGGLSEKLATTYDAMVDNLADFQADMDAAMGEGYNEGRKEGLQAQMDWMSGESGAAVEEANRAIGRSPFYQGSESRSVLRWNPSPPTRKARRRPCSPAGRSRNRLWRKCAAV